MRAGRQLSLRGRCQHYSAAATRQLGEQAALDLGTRSLFALFNLVHDRLPFPGLFHTRGLRLCCLRLAVKRKDDIEFYVQDPLSFSAYPDLGPTFFFRGFRDARILGYK